MFPFMIPLVGAGIGAIANRKDPLKGALIGGGLGMAGGAALPGMIGTQAAAQPSRRPHQGLIVFVPPLYCMPIH